MTNKPPMNSFLVVFRYLRAASLHCVINGSPMAQYSSKVISINLLKNACLSGSGAPCWLVVLSRSDLPSGSAAPPTTPDGFFFFCGPSDLENARANRLANVLPLILEAAAPQNAALWCIEAQPSRARYAVNAL